MNASEKKILIRMYSNLSKRVRNAGYAVVKGDPAREAQYKGEIIGMHRMLQYMDSIAYEYANENGRYTSFNLEKEALLLDWEEAEQEAVKRAERRKS